ncbi:hypothetical protein BCR33DRAFT_196411 [Rhizoclosmatium globosum]|uniref:Uncharacterized protein n=1 Tax=Rhizoclosmatium globosum TaxID=329046 RepID=A0A1Y2CDT8_9FUNG|nr:hypothetical protein BCR33DRAFT_196411 [Rhizoclosmatium globosum]|eukprot:ORY45209.1 hypothetical protein BCR33DRAFT_196411 [Rhizoclosmatium globosum]
MPSSPSKQRRVARMAAKPVARKPSDETQETPEPIPFAQLQRDIEAQQPKKKIKRSGSVDDVAVSKPPLIPLPQTKSAPPLVSSSGPATLPSPSHLSKPSSFTTSANTPSTNPDSASKKNCVPTALTYGKSRSFLQSTEGSDEAIASTAKDEHGNIIDEGLDSSDDDEVR